MHDHAFIALMHACSFHVIMNHASCWQDAVPEDRQRFPEEESSVSRGASLETLVLGFWEDQAAEPVQEAPASQETADTPTVLEEESASATPLAVETPAQPASAAPAVSTQLAVPASFAGPASAGGMGATPAASPSEMPPPQGVPARLECITSTTHKSQWMKLERVCNGPRAAQFPEIARAFGSGTKAERTKVLRDFVQNGENLEALEGTFKATRTHSERLKTTRRLMTIAQMQLEGFSECPSSI